MTRPLASTVNGVIAVALLLYVPAVRPVIGLSDATISRSPIPDEPTTSPVIVVTSSPGIGAIFGSISHVFSPVFLKNPVSTSVSASGPSASAAIAARSASYA